MFSIEIWPKNQNHDFDQKNPGDEQNNKFENVVFVRLNTNELADAVKEPVLDNDYKSILLDITKMVLETYF